VYFPGEERCPDSGVPCNVSHAACPSVENDQNVLIAEISVTIGILSLLWVFFIPLDFLVPLDIYLLEFIESLESLYSMGFIFIRIFFSPTIYTCLCTRTSMFS
jgi:hypothetical protein